MRRGEKVAQSRRKTSLKLPSLCKIAFCTALRVKLKEVAMNNLVLRVPLKSFEKNIGNQKYVSSESVQLEKALYNAVAHLQSQKLCQKEVTGGISVKAIRRKVTSVLSDKNSLHVQNTSPKTIKKYGKVQSDLMNGKKHKLLHKTQETLYTVNRNSASYSGLKSLQTRLNVDFSNLSELVNEMKLPSSGWQVTVMMRHDFSTAFKFASNSPPKCVTFSQKNPNCKIFMNGVPVMLLGCPKSISSVEEIEILLDIVHRLDFKDCMVAKL